MDGTDGDDRDWSELNTLKRGRMKFQHRGSRLSSWRSRTAGCGRCWLTWRSATSTRKSTNLHLSNIRITFAGRKSRRLETGPALGGIRVSEVPPNYFTAGCSPAVFGVCAGLARSCRWNRFSASLLGRRRLTMRGAWMAAMSTPADSVCDLKVKT